ncbi:hypothetical protein Trydic_g19682 [Trypoxylus dichotomus]
MSALATRKRKKQQDGTRFLRKDRVEREALVSLLMPFYGRVSEAHRGLACLQGERIANLELVMDRVYLKDDSEWNEVAVSIEILLAKSISFSQTCF